MNSSPGASSGIALLAPMLPVMALLAGWGAFALWYQVLGGRALKAMSVALWAVFSGTVLVASSFGRFVPAVLVFGAAFGALLIWWRRRLPSNDRIWADDVSQMTKGVVQDSRVTLRNVRNFDWRTNSDYTQRWETRSYDLRILDTVDLILSYWSYRAIAHVLVSFGFADGDHVVFSVEIRRQRGAEYSELGGFFKEFNLSVVAADERDIIRVRTNVRGEDDYLYRIGLTKAAMRSLFLAYVDQANELLSKPRFYNTLSVNCTTLVYHMMKHVVGYLPWDYRLLLSGYLPGYFYRIGAMDTRYSLRELRKFGRITERAKQSDRNENFSADIRRGVPPLELQTPATGAR
jgi:hypothetical protein